MKTKRLKLIISLAATVLIASPLIGAQEQKKSKTTSQSPLQRMTARTAQLTRAYQRGTNSSYRGTRQYAAPQRYVSTPQYSAGRYYTQNRYAGQGYYGGTPNYYGGRGYYYGGSNYPYYGYYSSWPSASYGYYPYASYGSYPYSYYRGYPGSYSYYQPRSGYDDATVAAVQHRLGQLGYNPGVVDGVIGPQTRAAIAAFENTHGMIADGTITTRLLNRMGLA
jgi:hypothetical protein